MFSCSKGIEILTVQNQPGIALVHNAHSFFDAFIDLSSRRLLHMVIGSSWLCMKQGSALRVLVVSTERNISIGYARFSNSRRNQVLVGDQLQECAHRMIRSVRLKVHQRLLESRVVQDEGLRIRSDRQMNGCLFMDADVQAFLVDLGRS